MAFYREIRNDILIANNDGIIDEEEFVLLWELNKTKNLDFPVHDYPRFDLENKDESECKAEFRFEKNDLPALAEALQIPDVFKCQQGTVCDGMTGLCIVLKRFAYPIRYSDMIPTFGLSVPELCMIFNTVVDYIYDIHGHRLTQWNDTLLNPDKLQVYADAVAGRGSALDNCFGFVDGTVRPICRPDENQRTVYNGHKRMHSLKFQSVVLPNGLIASLYGPVDQETVSMTLIVHEPIGGDRYLCFLSSPDRDARVSYARYVNTRSYEGYTYNYYNRDPTSSYAASLPGARRILLDRNYDNYFGIYYCRARKAGRLLTTITGTVLLRNAKIVPGNGLYTKTVNVGDVGVSIEMAAISSSNNRLAWRFNDSSILQYGSSTYSIAGAITEDNAGVYECHYENERQDARQGLVRLIVRGCPANRWGSPDCSGICDNCYNGGICNDLNGRCICPAGFRGRNCLQACGSNSFGFNCEIVCSSSTYSCMGLVFCLPDPLGCTCAPGYESYNCQTECRPGMYGASCLLTCHCLNGASCNQYTGVCPGECEPGWSGEHCQIPDVCSSDFYGDDCTRKCQCLEDQPCDKSTGRCSNGQCKLGFAVYEGGMHCEACRGATYGSDCAGTCNCAEANCNRATGVCNGGCNTNWAGADCTTGVLSVNNSKANSGQTSNFTCVVTRNLLPSASVGLYRHSDRVQHQPYSSAVDDSGVLLTFKFSVQDVQDGEGFTCFISTPIAQLIYVADMYELPVLAAPPRATDTQGQQVTIEWDAWKAGENLGDPPITAYTVYYRPQTGIDQWQKSVELSPTGTLSATVTGLNPETDYEMSVTVTREGPGGEGTRGPTLTVTTTCSEPLAVPNSIQAYHQQETLRQITVTWQSLDASLSGCSSSVIHYRIRFGPALNPSPTEEVDVRSLSVNLTDLKPYTQYRIFLSAVNEFGAGPWSKDVYAYTAEEAPPPPQQVDITRTTETSITLLITAVSPFNLNGNLSHYLIRYHLLSGPQNATIVQVHEKDSRLTYTITGLSSLLDYSIQVKIVNGVGESDWSEAVRGRTVRSGAQSGSAGAVAGGVIAVLLVLVLAIIVLVFVMRRRRKQASENRQANNGGFAMKSPDEGTISENTGKAGDKLETAPEVDIKPSDDKTIYEISDLKPSEPTLLKQDHIPPKPNHKPPPPGLSIPKPLEGAPHKPHDAENDLSERESPDALTNQPSNEKAALGPLSLATANQNSEYGNVNLIPQLSVPLPVGALEDYIINKKESSTDNLKYEFSLLPSDQTSPWTIASNSNLKTRNRFKNIIPYDHSRVPLEPIEGVPLSNYYNASYIQDHKKNTTFIAAMGPNTAAVNDFWRLIWQEQINIIVMLTQLVEGTKEKCKRYWPARKDREERYGTIVVKLTHVEVFSDYTIHTLRVRQADDENCHLMIKHFNLTSWPDMGVPLYPTSVLYLVQVVKDTRSQMLINNTTKPDKRLLVHCSAGVGRTGTFLAIYTLMDMMQEEGELSVFGFVNQMRKNRVNMVQTYDQYAFVYEALLEGHLSGDTRIPVKHFDERFAKMKNINPKTRKRYIEEEFQTLNKVTPPPRWDAFGESTLAENANKNRSGDILPLERNRPKLVPTEETGSSTYINASYVDSLKKKEAFITTQMPLPNTVADIWRLAYDCNSLVIVMMNDPDSSSKEPDHYLPDAGTAKFGPINVNMIEQSKGRIFHSRTLEVWKTGEEEKTLTLQHFQLQGWASNEDKPTSPLSILELLDAVQCWQRECQSTGPVIVQCLNGIGRSGVFCTVWTIVEKMSTEDVVDVFQAVKRIRMNRPQMIESMEQYLLCYEVIAQHIQRFRHYDNLQ